MDLTLTPDQYRFLSAQDDVLCEIGGRGTGKTSRNLALWVLDQCMRYPGNQGVVASSTNPQLRTATVPTMHEMWDEIGISYKYSAWEGTVHFENGSWFRYQPLVSVPENEIKGSNLGFLGVDEVDACPRKHIEKLMGGLRRPGTSEQCRFVGNSPPQGHWLETWFVPEVAKLEGREVMGRLLRSSTYDNHFLSEKFVRRCELMWPKGTAEHRRYMLGEMRVPLDGAVYKELLPHHQIKYSQVPWDRVCGYINALDLGFRHWSAFLRMAVTNLDEVFVFAEYSQREGYLDILAENILRLLDMDPAGLGQDGAIYCDHDAQDRAELQRLGIQTVPAVKDDKLAGIDCVKTRLRLDKLFIVADNCPHLMSEFPLYRWADETEKTSGKDEPLKKNDDHLDALRYGVGSYDLDRSEIDLGE